MLFFLRRIFYYSIQNKLEITGFTFVIYALIKLKMNLIYNVYDPKQLHT